jgi:hypothetical protein
MDSGNFRRRAIEDAPSTNIPEPRFNRKKPTNKRGILSNRDRCWICTLNYTKQKEILKGDRSNNRINFFQIGMV